MDDAIAFVERYEAWFYALAFVGLAYHLRLALRAQRQLGQTPFGLEREAALGRRSGALAMIFAMVLLAVAVFSVVTFVAPARRATAPGPVEAPGVSQTVEAAPSALSGTPLPTLLSVDGAGCVNAAATVTSPTAGQVVTATVEVRGTANIVNFAFYKLEISGPATGGNWNTIAANNTPVADGVLGAWDAGLFSAGSYAFRLVVFDVAGAAPPPCVVPIVIASP